MRFLSSHISFTKHISMGVSMATLSLLSLLASCSDDNLITSTPNERLISFNVSEAENSPTAERTRGETLYRNNILKLNGGERDLFLVPVVEESFTDTGYASPTRGTVVNAENMESFGVYAGYASEAGSSAYKPDYMSNVEITRSSDWTPADEYLWPGNGALHFNAYSPFFSSDHTEGITDINNTEGVLQLNYTVPAAVEDQSELLYATPVDASSSPCNLTFNHALTAIRFVTGAEMAPCEVKSISIGNVLSEGVLNIESGIWDSLSKKADYSVETNVTLAKEEGSEYVEPSTPITTPDQTFMLLPQELGEDAQITIVVEVNGKETTLTSSLNQTKWNAGKTITYRISANPEADSLILNVSGDFQTLYTGSPFSFKVESSMNSEEGKVPVSWIAEFIDDSGNVIPQPNWIDSMTLSGTGDMEGKGETVMQDLIFENMSPQTRILQNTADINISSGFTPYNLSSSTGNATVENTANTYVINAPGKYSLPLVYGNAVKNSSDNKEAYVSSSHNRNALKTFTNHLNNPITSPYIYENASCNPKDAILVWEDELNLVRNVKLSSDYKTITFDIPHNTIRQGNAIIAVRDQDEQIMWSWQLWVTDYSPADGYATITSSGKNYDIATANLGYIAGGDVTRFPESTVKIRFTQTGLPDGVEPLSKTVELVQSEALISTPDCNTFYQWGRKDPMMSSVKQWYNASHQQITTLPTESVVSIAGSNIIKNFILQPQTFFTGSHDVSNPSTYPNNNLWNISYNASNIKSIYDPSPVGFVVPYTEPFQSFAHNPATYPLSFVSTSTDSQKMGFYLSLPTGGTPLFFPGFAYRAGSTGDLASGSFACYWTSHAINLINAGCFEFENQNSKQSVNQLTDPLYHAMSIRPVRE